MRYMSRRKAVDIGTIYDVLIKEAEYLLAYYKPCRFEDGKCEFQGRWSGIGGQRKNGCCGSCKHLGPEGCTTKCLGCKTFLCYAASEKYPVLHQKLQTIQGLAYRFGIRLSCYTSKEEALSYYSPE